MSLKRLLLLTMLLNGILSIPAYGAPLPVPVIAELKHSLNFVLEYVLVKKGLVKNPNIEEPELHLESVTRLDIFQNAITGQWGFKPDRFSNAYGVSTNQIFLIDDQSYYDKTGSCIDDSLAHELAHYIQVKYQKWDLADESAEWDAVDIQTQFREEFCSKHENSQIPKIRY